MCPRTLLDDQLLLTPPSCMEACVLPPCLIPEFWTLNTLLLYCFFFPVLRRLLAMLFYFSVSKLWACSELRLLFCLALLFSKGQFSINLLNKCSYFESLQQSLECGAFNPVFRWERKGEMTCPGHKTNNYQAWDIILGLSDSASLHPTKLCLEDFFCYAYILSAYMCMRVGTKCHGTYVEIRTIYERACSLFFTIWVSGIKLRLLGLLSNNFNCWAISLVILRFLQIISDAYKGHN